MLEVLRHSDEIDERPAGYVGPDLSPRGLVLEPHRLGDGVYALMANIPPRDNNGVIAGDRAALVVDAGINGAVARQIQGRVRELTDRPLRYLVNTTYHGDHTFGNADFGDDVIVVSSRQNANSMRELEREKAMRSGNLLSDPDALADVTRWRRPDLRFDTYLAVDLGGRTVELWHFGPGNGPGDTIVYEPATKSAWTGNLLPRAGIPTMLLEGGPLPYVRSLRRMRHTLDVETIVPGHGPMGPGRPAIDWLIGYLEGLHEAVDTQRRAGLSAAEAVEVVRLADVGPRLPDAPGGAPSGLPASANELLGHLHRLNVLATYRALEAGDGGAA